MLVNILFLFGTFVSYIISTISMNLIQFILFFTVKPFSNDLYCKLNGYLITTALCSFVTWIDWYCKCDIYLYMDKNDYETYFGKETMYMISNHSSELDWIVGISLAEKAHLLGNVRVYIKDIVKYIPGLGWGMLFSDFILLSRNVKKDKIIIENKITALMNYPDYTMTCILPEGTICSEEKLKISQKFARDNNLPELKHHLVPKTKGFLITLPIIRKKLKAVYDLTMVYSHKNPKIMDLILGKKNVVHLHMKRIPIESVPENENEVSTFVYDLFKEKDNLVETFYKTGDLRSTNTSIEKIKLKRNIGMLISTIFLYSLHFITMLIIMWKLIENGYLSYIFYTILIFVLSVLATYKIIFSSSRKKARIENNSKLQ